MATKAPTAARTPARRPAKPTEPEEQILEFTTADPEPDAEERKTLFKIDGEEFSVPKVIDERLTFLAMNRIRSEGTVFASMYVVELLLGAPQYARLIDLYEQRRLTPEQFDQATGLIVKTLYDRIGKSDKDPEKAGKASATS